LACGAGPEGDSALDLVQDPVKFAQAVSEQYGGVVGMQLAGNRVVLVRVRRAALWNCPPARGVANARLPFHFIQEGTNQ
jgi:hypothetical protein